MKTLYLIGGTMGVGKTAVCRELKRILPNAVTLDTTGLSPAEAAAKIAKNNAPWGAGKKRNDP